MFKLVTLIVLGYLLYYLIAQPTKSLKKANPIEELDQEPDSGEFVEYEEIE